MTTTLDFTDAYGEFSNYSEDGFTVTAIGGSGHFLIDGGLYEGLYDIRASEPGAEFSAISASVGGSPEGIPLLFSSPPSTLMGHLLRRPLMPPVGDSYFWLSFRILLRSPAAL